MVIIRAVQESIVKNNSSGKNPEIGRVHQPDGTYGLAIDIGTTTIAVELYDLQSRQFLEGKTEMNEQTALGADVMMRLMHAASGKAEQLQKMILQQIHRMAEELCGQLFGSDGEKQCSKIKKLTVVGNTVMCHLFLGQDISGLTGAPFSSSYNGTFRCYGKDLGWQGWETSEVIVLPGIAAHVGADAAAVMGAERLWDSEKIQLAIDIGTNAEILFNDHGRITVCSAAAGPAFEGKGISCGKRAGKGAVNGVRILRSNGNILLDVIAEKTSNEVIPEGICGSGLVDAIAQMLHCGVLQSDGYLLSRREAEERGISGVLCQRLVDNSGQGQCFVLFDPKADRNMSDGKRITISQEDIRNFQLAKAAVQAGIQLLLTKKKRTLEQVDQVIVAGVFGTFLHPDNAGKCGILPSVEEDRITFSGNAAGRGAANALLKESFLAELEELVPGVEHVELAEENCFQEKFMNAMELKPW